MRWLGQEPLAGRPTLEKLRIRAGVVLGVLFLAGPISDLGDESLEPSRQIVLGIGVALFIAVYLSILPPARWLSRLGAPAVLGAFALLPAIASPSPRCSSTWPPPQGCCCRRASRPR